MYYLFNEPTNYLLLVFIYDHKLEMNKPNGKI